MRATHGNARWITENSGEVTLKSTGNLILNMGDTIFSEKRSVFYTEFVMHISFNVKDKFNN